MITRQNVLGHELIGLNVLIVGASNPTHIGVTGQVIDETRNLLVIRTRAGLKRIPKKYSVFRFTLPDGVLVEVDGTTLMMAPERRINLHRKYRGK